MKEDYFADRSATGASEGVKKSVGKLRNVGGTERYGKAIGKVRKGSKKVMSHPSPMHTAGVLVN